MRRPRPALPFTVIAEPDAVHLVAGEDVRYTLRGPKIDRWLPGLLDRCDGSRAVDDVLAAVAPAHRDAAREAIDRGYGERILVDGSAEEAHAPRSARPVYEGPLAARLAVAAPGDGEPLAVLCQDRLDYAAALAFNRAGHAAWMWATTGPMARAFVSPVFVRDAGPCLECLVRHFKRLSPTPDLYDALLGHEGEFAPVPFPQAAIEIVRQLIVWKAEQLARQRPSPALFRLHVVEAATLETSTHGVYPDPDCPACGHGSVV